MNVFLARLGLSDLQDSSAGMFEELAQLDRVMDHRVVQDPVDADLILFTQCHLLPDDWRLNAIRGAPVARQLRHKVAVYDMRDTPWCGFPGVYVSMPRHTFNRDFQRAWSYLRMPVEEPVTGIEPDLLFSFIGSPTHRCRDPLFKLAHPDAVVDEVRRFVFFDPSSLRFEERRAHFRDVLSRSRFVLCPRGKGTSSFRLFETLAAGRVPVIIADDWVPPSGPDWETFCLRWPEGKSAGLIEAIEERDRDWPAMSAAALAAHREHFAPDVWFHQVITLYEEIAETMPRAFFPRAGIRDRAFLEAGSAFFLWRATSMSRRWVKRILQRLGLISS